MCWNRISAIARTLIWACAVAGTWLVWCPSTAWALRAEAIAGEPFGVGRISLPLSDQTMPPVLGAKGLAVSTPDGRILYPVVETPPDNALVKDLLLGSPLLRGGPVREQVGGILQEIWKRPPTLTIYFLFRGSDPLQVTLQARAAHKFVLQPRHDPHAHRALLGAWWHHYTAKPKGLFRPAGNYPPVVSNYLQAMLARRLGLPPAESADEGSWQDQLEGQLGLFLGTEQVRLAIARDRMLGRSASAERATLPLPEPPRWPPLALPPAAKDVKIEPIAGRVPVECLYVRLGNYNNFLWLQDTLKIWGDDLSNLIAMRGLDTGQSRRMEERLVLKQTALSRILGPTVISDVAIIGTDMFMREGAAFGILFEARNSFLLENDLKRQRSERIKRGGVSEKKVKVAGRDVSLLSSPDGSVRSFYLADKGYVFVTTSETLMRRFIETGKKDGDSLGDSAGASGATGVSPVLAHEHGQDARGTQPSNSAGSLGDSAEFRHARTIMPLARDDTVFVYLSDAFFRNMAGPHYWIEISRRLQATADIQLLEMASLASATEGKPGETIRQLIAGGFLPPEFGPRADGSRAQLLEGEAVDSLRGRRGFFLPAADVPVSRVAPAEAAAYQKFLDFYHAKWGRLDPMIVGVKRHAPTDGVERVVLDIHANPFARRHFERLSEWIGPADRDRLASIPGDLAAFEAQLVNQRVFAGLRDFGLPFDLVEGRFVPAGGLRNMLVGYVGTTGPLGFLGLLDRRIGGAADARGTAGQEGGMWRHRDERFTVFSFQPSVLAEVCPQLRFEPAERAAQIRLRVGDVSRARLTPALGTMSYLRTRATCLGNLQLMHAMNQQLHVPGPDCKAAAELILDARLVCPLGGRYDYRLTDDGLGYWTSTALETSPGGSFFNVRVPPGYTAPPLSWFRGLAMDVTMTAKDLSAHVEVLMRPPKGPVLPEPEEQLATPVPEDPTSAPKEKK